MSLKSRINALENAPEAKNKPVKILYQHDDGRVCNHDAGGGDYINEDNLGEPTKFYADDELRELANTHLVVRIINTSDPPNRE